MCSSLRLGSSSLSEKRFVRAMDDRMLPPDLSALANQLKSCAESIERARPWGVAVLIEKTADQLQEEGSKLEPDWEMVGAWLSFLDTFTEQLVREVESRPS